MCTWNQPARVSWGGNARLLSPIPISSAMVSKSPRTQKSPEWILTQETAQE